MAENENNAEVLIGSDMGSEVSLGALASSETTGNSELLSRDIENAITQKVVSNVNLDRVDTIENCTAYLVDLSGDGCTVVPSWVKSIKNLVVSDKAGEISENIQRINEVRHKQGMPELRSDAALYFKTKSGVSMVGYVDQLQMYKIIRDYVNVSLSNRAKVYVSTGGKAMFKEWKASDTRGVRLKL